LTAAGILHSDLCHGQVKVDRTTLSQAYSVAGAGDARGSPAQSSGTAAATVCKLGLKGMRHAKMTHITVTSFSSANSIHVVIVMGESSTALGVQQANNLLSARAQASSTKKTRVIETNAIATSKQGQLTASEGCWVTKDRLRS